MRSGGKGHLVVRPGELFHSLLDAGLDDTVEPAITPIIPGGGVPFLATPAGRCPLKLESHQVYPTGVVLLEYAVEHP